MTLFCRYTWEVSKNDDLTYDLANLYAYDGAPIDPKEYKYGRHHDGVMFSANPELYIKQHARDDIQLLVNKVYSLYMCHNIAGIPIANSFKWYWRVCHITRNYVPNTQS